MPIPFRVGFVVFPGMTQLDLTGPHEVFSRIPGCEIRLAWKVGEPLTADGGLTFVPTTTFDECPALDLLCVPGGGGINAILTDAVVLAFVRRCAETARYVTAVCTGSLVLGAAGLLSGKRAATHWMSMEFLERFGATPVHERVVIDGKLVTGGGVTAGIDFALRVAAEVAGEARAREIQLAMEYAPEPPFDSGHPRRADPALVEAVTSRSAGFLAERRAQVERAARALELTGEPG